MTFDEWFEEYAKKEPHVGKALTDMYDEESSLSSRLAVVRTMIYSREMWLAMRNAALYAWNIKDKDKK